MPHIPHTTRWSVNGVSVAGGNGEGNATNQLNWPHGIFVDEDQTIVIADFHNHRIIQWKAGDTNGKVIAGGDGCGDGLNQLDKPIDVLIDKETDNLIICDSGNQRVVQWSRRSTTKQGETLIDNITCSALTMDNQRNLYVSDIDENEVRQYRMDDMKATLVAGGNGKGAGLGQLNSPSHIFIDRQQTIYVSDTSNNRVMKWPKGATEGIIVVGQGTANASTQLSGPEGLFVDTLGTLYIADWGSHSVLRWNPETKRGTVIAGGNGRGSAANQLPYPQGLFLDRHGNLYVTDWGNNRVQRFSIEKN